MNLIVLCEMTNTVMVIPLSDLLASSHSHVAVLKTNIAPYDPAPPEIVRAFDASLLLSVHLKDKT